MQLLPALKFVQGAVAKKDFAPALTHFRIARRTVIGFNGTLGISSPIDLDLDISPKAVDFVKAINACTETISLHVADNGKLVVRSGDFKCFIDCDGTGTFPDIKPQGQIVKLPDSLLPALRYLQPFMATDASRPWACAILFNGESAFASNNIAVLQYWLGFNFPGKVIVPAPVVNELVRIGEDPTHLQVSDRRLIFHYEDGRWLSTQLLVTDWPDTERIFKQGEEFKQRPFPAGFFDAVDRLLPFCDELNRCYFKGDHIATIKDSGVAGTSVAVECPSVGIFNAKQLSNIREIAKTVNFEAYPTPITFYGDRCRGVMAGIRI